MQCYELNLYKFKFICDELRNEDCMKKITAEQVQQIRNNLQLTQEEFAHKIGVAHSTIHRWERGKSMPSRLALNRINELQNNSFKEKAQ